MRALLAIPRQKINFSKHYKKMRTRRIIIILVLAAGIFSTCKKEDNLPELVARTGPDTTASIGDTVWLVANASTGTDYQVSWSFHNQPGNDTITNSTADTAFFIPMHNGTYQVKLTITRGELFSSDYQNIIISGAVRLDDLISSDTRLKKIATGDDVDYIATGEVAVTGALIVDIGVIIEFKEGASLVIRDGGTIYAENASFVAADSTWKGICLKTTGNAFANCLIENAGNASFTPDPGEKASVIMIGGATLAFSGNTLKYSGGYGLIVKDNSDFFYDTENQVYAYRNNRFVMNALGPMVIPVHVLSDLSGQLFENETPGTYIEIYGSTYPASGSIPWFSDQGMPYKIRGLLEFNRDLTINNGVRMYFEQNAGLKVSGILTVSGTQESPVLMDGVTSQPGSWKGVYVRVGQADLSCLNLLNAGNSMFTGTDQIASLVVEKLLSMKNSTISGSRGIGLYMPGDAHIQYSENFKGNTFENNAVSAIRIRMDDVGKVADGNTLRSPSASVPAVEVHMGLDDPLGTWKNLDAEYDFKILETLTIKATKELAIEAGAVIKMSVGTTLQVSGGLLASGSAGSEITIEGTQSKKGHWDGIFLKGTQKVQLDFMLIRDGGGDLSDKANLIVEAGASDVSLTNSTVNNSKGYGVLVKSGASDFGINDPASSNTLEGDLGGFHQESK
jgi:hypothetical protein